MPDPSSTGIVTPPSQPLTMRDYIKQQSEKMGIPSDLALAIVDTESGGVHSGQQGMTTSRTGARGFFQLMPETAKDLGVDPADPFQNIDGGLRYFKQLKDSYGGDYRLALAAYNAGPNHPALAQGKVPEIPETQDYVMKVLDRWKAGNAGAQQAPAAATVKPPAKAATAPPSFATAGQLPPSPALAAKQTPSGNLFEQAVMEPIAGFGKQVATSVGDVGRLAERVTGVNLPDLPEGDLTQRTLGEKVGGFAEQAAEFAAPAEAVSGAAKSMQVVQRLIRLGFTPARARLAAAAMEGGLQAGPAAAIAEVHGDNPESAAIISAAAPVVGQMVTNMAPAIRQAAITRIARYMERGVTKDLTSKTERDLAQAASDFIDLPLQRTWRQTAKLTEKSQETAGKSLEAALATPLGDTPVPIAPVYQELDNLVDEAQHLLPIPAAGAATPHFKTKDVTEIPGAVGIQQSVGALKKYLADYSAAYGTHIPARMLHDVKEVWWDAIYGRQKGKIVTSTGELLTTAQKEAMLRGGAGIMKVLESDAPEISQLDTAVNHAANLNRFVQKLSTLERKGNLASRGARYAASAVGSATGGTAGFMAGSAAGHPFIGASIGGHIGYATGRLLLRAVTSPRWRFLPNAARRELADALAAGRADQIRKIVTPLVLSATAEQDDLLSSSNAAR